MKNTHRHDARRPRARAPWLRLLALLALLAPGCGDTSFLTTESYTICRCSADELCVNERCVPIGGLDLVDAASDADAQAACEAAAVRVEELRVASGEGADFIELSGPAGAPLAGHRVVARDLSGRVVVNVQLSGALGGDGLWLGTFGPGVAGADLQLGVVGFSAPAGLVVLQGCGGARLDAVAYGATAAGLDGEGDPAPTTATGQSLSRCPGAEDTDDNRADFQVNTSPSPGATDDDLASAVGCRSCDPAALEGRVWLAELLHDPVGVDEEATAFVELRGEAGASLDGARLERWEEGASDWVVLSGLDGLSLSATDGRLLIAEDDALTGAALVAPGVDLDNDLGALRLTACASQTLDAVGFGALDAAAAGLDDLAPDAADGQSLSRCPDEAPRAEADAWTEATPTPGAANACP